MKSFFILLMAACTLLSSNIANAQKAKSGQDKTNKVSVYTCPMHSEVTMSKPGTCDKCGMALTKTTKELMKSDAVKSYTCPKHPSISLSKSGTCPECGTQLVLSGKEMMKREIVKSYTCPMHPEVASKSPSKCPKCNMALTVQKH